MIIVDNEPLYKRNARLAFAANLGGMFLLVGAVFVLFSAPDRLLLYLAFLLGGILLVQVGMYFGRWGRRADLALNQALKSLNDSYTIYHQRAPIPHLLVGPTGLWILLPRHTRGVIFYNKEKQRWELKGGNIFKGLWQRITQERLGRPHFEAMIEAGQLDRHLEKRWQGDEPLQVQAAVVFLNEGAEVHAGDAPFPAVQAKKLTQVVAKGAKKGTLNRAQLQDLNRIFAGD